jgi:pimeloyl-ACP methyl ester carboxylesterase
MATQAATPSSVVSTAYAFAARSSAHRLSRGAATVLVHSGGVTREEGGFFTCLAGALADAGLPSLRFDASRNPDTVRRLLLFNPLLNYKRRFVDEKPYWHDDHIDQAVGGPDELAAQGLVAHSPSFRLGRPLLNEVFYVEPHRALGAISTPTLIVHGTGDTFIPI